MTRNARRLLALIPLLLVMGEAPSAASARNGSPSSTPVRPAGASRTAWAIETSPSPGSYNELYGAATDSSGAVWAVGRYIPKQRSYALIERSFAGGPWSVSFSYGSSSANSYLLDVAAESPTDAWAVGYTDAPNYTKSRILLVHWDGRSWKVVPTDQPGGLWGVSADSADDVWAVGYQPLGETSACLVEHWNGSRWSVVPSPDPGSYGNSLWSVVAISASDAWAVGSQDTTRYGSVALSLNWDGKAWHSIPGLTPGVGSELRGVSAASPADVWAVGYFYVQTQTGTASYNLAERWDGKGWTGYSTPDPTGDDVLEGVDVVCTNDVWAVGSSARHPPLVDHWTSRGWKVVDAPGRLHALNLLFSVASSSPKEIWAVGLDIDLHGYTYHTLVERGRA